MRTPGPSDIAAAQDRMVTTDSLREMARVIIDTFDLDDIGLGGFALEQGVADLLEVVQGYTQDEYTAHGDSEYDRGREAEKADFPSDAVAELEEAKKALDELDFEKLRHFLHDDVLDTLEDVKSKVDNAVRLFNE